VLPVSSAISGEEILHDFPLRSADRCAGASLRRGIDALDEFVPANAAEDRAVVLVLLPIVVAGMSEFNLHRR
jgi:hypothetical protein